MITDTNKHPQKLELQSMYFRYIENTTKVYQFNKKVKNLAPSIPQSISQYKFQTIENLRILLLWERKLLNLGKIPKLKS